MNIARDLFGHPVDPRRGARGRPRHFATPDLRDRARAMHDAGADQAQIADALGITGPTLRRHYHRELESTSQVWRRFEGDDNAR